MSTVLLQREWKLQMARKKPGRAGGYPGLFWAAVALSLPLIHQALASYRLDFLPERRYSFELAGFGLIGLTCLRACISCAASMAEEVQHHSIQLVKQLPRAGGLLGLLGMKTLVVSVPLLLEWLLFAGMAGLLWLLGVPVDEWAPQRFIAVGFTSMFFFCSLGLWIGARLADPDRAANNARVAVTMILVGWALLEGVLKGPLLLIAALIWVAFMFRSSPRVASAFQASLPCCLSFSMWHQAYMVGDLRLSQLSPLMAAFNPELTRDDCILYCVGGVAILLLNLRQLRKM